MPKRGLGLIETPFAGRMTLTGIIVCASPSLSQGEKSKLRANAFRRAAFFWLFEGMRVEATPFFELGYGLQLVGVSLRVSLNL
jgi:hypothetical protein